MCLQSETEHRLALQAHHYSSNSGSLILLVTAGAEAPTRARRNSTLSVTCRDLIRFSVARWDASVSAERTVSSL